MAGLVVWSIVRQRRREQAQKTALDRLGFHRCPEKKAWLEETITRIEFNRGHRYEVRDPRRLAREPAVYYYLKLTHQHADQDAIGEEEILFPLKRASTAGLFLSVKPSAVAPGLATRMMGAIAAGPWDSQPDDLHRLELPRDLQNSNLLAALGPPGASLYDLIDSRTLSVVQGLGDTGAISVRFRDEWCTVGSPAGDAPLRLDQLMGRIRPLL
jgi:hypothetical protein